jgi:hypothetical protein
LGRHDFGVILVLLFGFGFGFVLVLVLILDIAENLNRDALVIKFYWKKACVSSLVVLYLSLVCIFSLPSEVAIQRRRRRTREKHREREKRRRKAKQDKANQETDKTTTKRPAGHFKHR